MVEYRSVNRVQGVREMKLRRLTLCCVVALATGLFVAGCSDAVSAIPQMEEREVATIFTTRDANAFRALF